MVVQREIRHGDGVDVGVGQVEIAVVLLDEAGFIPGDIHMLGDFPPSGDFRFAELRLFQERRVGGRPRLAQAVQRRRRALQGPHAHIVGVGVVVHHHVEFVRPHHAIEAVQAGFPALFHPAGQKTSDLQQHFRPVIVQKIQIAGDVGVVPDAVGHGGAGLQLQAGVLPQGAGLFAVQRGQGVAGPAAIQHPGPLHGLGQGVVAGRPGIGEQVEGQAAGLGVPEGVAVVGFPRQALGPDVVAHAAAVVDLGQLEAAKADALLLVGVSVGLDLHVGGAPIGVPIGFLGRQGVVQGDLFSFF